ncbi:MAG: sigma-70 family RNA polymerase sigma factor [Firmicutes bacterium]|nr:sigma-70 family RNA polymerase sigma factor [Bacillota bacterium]
MVAPEKLDMDRIPGQANEQTTEQKLEREEEHGLVGAARRGCRQAMAELLARAYPVVFGYLLRLSQDRGLAEDLTQEALLRAVVHIRRFRPEARFSTWVLAIATNLYRDHCRKAWREQPVSGAPDGSDAGVGSAGASLPADSSAADVEGAALRHIQCGEVLQALATLAPEKRAVFILKHYYGLRYQEIAGLLHCPDGTVKSRLHQAVQEIRRFLKTRRSYEE